MGVAGIHTAENIFASVVVLTFAHVCISVECVNLLVVLCTAIVVVVCVIFYLDEAVTAVITYASD